MSENKQIKYSTVNSKDELLDLQRFFAQMIRQPLLEGDLMQSNDGVDDLILANEEVSSHTRLEFYARQYWWRILGSFDEDFPSVQRLLSVDIYEALRNDYLVKNPSISYTLRHLGSRFPDFIKDNPNLTAPYTSLIYDAAVFDWARMSLFDVGSMQSITTDEVTQEDFSTQKLYLQDYVKLIHVTYPIDKLYTEGLSESREATSNVELEKEEKKDQSKLDLSFIKEEEIYLALHRLDGRIFSKRLSLSAFQILNKFKQGLSLIELEEELSKSDSVSEEEIENYFTEWMSLSWLYLKEENI